MNRSRTNLLLVILTIGTACNAGTADATDHRMWREQVARPVDSVIELESKTVDAEKKIGNDSLPWRYQVKLAGKSRVFLAERAQWPGKSSDWRLWREQIKANSSRNKQSVASNLQQTDKFQFQ